MIYFESGFNNQLLINQQLPDEEKYLLAELAKIFEEKYGKTGFFLVASSGTSKKNGESVKLIALSREAILNSALRFNQYFQADRSDSWGCVLPTFHVAGLGIYARSYLTGSTVFVREWSVSGFKNWIEDNKISFISLVPAQLFDLAQMEILSPSTLKKVFVGAGALSPELKLKILNLKWPLVETYGMTETSSMIAIKNGELYEFMPQIEFKLKDDCLSIKCNSMFTAIVQKIGVAHVITPCAEWYESQDKFELVSFNDKVGFKYLGRSAEYIKILGEGVSLSELRAKLEQVLLMQNLNLFSAALMEIVDERAGHKLILVVEENISDDLAGQIITKYNEYVRRYEKILSFIKVEKIPRTHLGKLKTLELSDKLARLSKKGKYGKD